jgi:hypothetical protein
MLPWNRQPETKNVVCGRMIILHRPGIIGAAKNKAGKNKLK